MRSVVRSLWALALLAAPITAQQQQAAAALPVLSPEAETALVELGPRFAGDTEQLHGWFRDQPVQYYNFGSVARPLIVGRVLWPIHGFDARGNPVAIRGQRPIFSSIPGLEGYSGLWRLEYIVTADLAQPNELRTVASVEAATRRRRATVRPTELVLNLPIVPRGTRLVQDSATGSIGWFEGREVQYFDFGPVSVAPAPMWRFALAGGSDSEIVVVEGQGGILDSVPVAPTYPDLWDIRFVRVDTTYSPNSIRSAAAVRSARWHVDSARFVANLPVTVVGGVRVARSASPITEFADMRSPFPPAPTMP